MTKHLWATFGQDLKLARTQLINTLEEEKFEPIEKRLLLMQNLTYLGCYNHFSVELESLASRKLELGRQILFRIWRWRRYPNPWLALIPPGEEEYVQQIINDLPNFGEGIVSLVGGIGDVLESKAIIIACAKSAPWINQFSFEPASIKNRKAIGGLWELSNNLQDRPSLTSTFFRLALLAKGLQDPPQPILPVPKVLKPRERTWLVCWRCKPNPQNPISAFSRSIPWPAIQKLLLSLQIYLKEANVQIYDLTAYTNNERAWLAQNCPSVVALGHKLGGLVQTLDWLRCSRYGVITVDTSLVHLAALSSEPALLLLPLFPDERWSELIKPESAYSRWVTTIQQKVFNNWTDPLKEVFQRVRHCCQIDS